MIAFFRNNQVVTTIPLALYVLMTHAAAILGYVSPISTTETNGGLLYGFLFHWVESQAQVSALTAAVLVFIQALLVNNLADEFRILSDRNWLPGMFFVLVTAILPGFLFVSPPLIAAFFVPIAVRRIMKVYKTPNATTLIFDVAFWTAMGVLFYPHALLLLIAALAGINLMRSFAVREQLVFFSAIFVANFLSWLGFFWYDMGGLFFKRHFMEIWGIFNFEISLTFNQWLQVGLLSMLFLMVVLSFSSYYSRQLIQTQKCISVLYWFFLLGCFGFFMSTEFYLTHFLIVMPSVGIFLSMTVMSIRSRILAEIFHLILLGALFTLQFYPL